MIGVILIISWGKNADLQAYYAAYPTKATRMQIRRISIFSTNMIYDENDGATNI